MENSQCGMQLGYDLDRPILDLRMQERVMGEADTYSPSATVGVRKGIAATYDLSPTYTGHLIASQQ